jgi:hypothetical protein
LRLATKGDYGGPGIVKGKFQIKPGVWRYNVAHKIEGGWGEMIHIYSEGNLKHAQEI